MEKALERIFDYEVVKENTTEKGWKHNVYKVSKGNLVM